MYVVCKEYESYDVDRPLFLVPESRWHDFIEECRVELSPRKYTDWHGNVRELYIGTMQVNRRSGENVEKLGRLRIEVWKVPFYSRECAILETSGDVPQDASTGSAADTD